MYWLVIGYVLGKYWMCIGSVVLLTWSVMMSSTSMLSTLSDESAGFIEGLPLLRAQCAISDVVMVKFYSCVKFYFENNIEEIVVVKLKKLVKLKIKLRRWYESIAKSCRLKRTKAVV